MKDDPQYREKILSLIQRDWGDSQHFLLLFFYLRPLFKIFFQKLFLAIFLKAVIKSV